MAQPGDPHVSLGGRDEVALARGIIELASEAILSTDREQRIVFCNRGAEEIFGWRREDLIGKSLDVLLPPRFRERHRTQVHGFAAEDRTARRMGERDVKVFGVRKSGEEFPAEAAISRSEIDGELRFNVILRDITERERARSELERLYDVSQRAVQARDYVLSVVAHDLRNPLTTMFLAAGALEKERAVAGDDRGARQAQVILNGCRRSERLIDDLLDLARADAGKLSMLPSRVSVVKVLGEAIESQRTHSPLHNFALEIDSRVDAVWADRDRLLQVLENLIGNATKFTPASGHIVIGADVRQDDVRFWVRDDGPGIDASALSRVFETFFQGTCGDRRGVGLGLPISKAIVEAHGGRIGVDSVVGQGSTFWFTLRGWQTPCTVEDHVHRTRAASSS